MLSLILAISCSLSVGVLIKVARARGILIEQSIAFNYVIASLLTLFLLKPDFAAFSASLQSPDGALLRFGLIGALGLLLPSVFLIQANSLRLSGIAKTDVAQRLSLFLALIGAFTFLGEAITTHKIIALALALVAMLLVLNKGSNHAAQPRSQLFLLLTWLGFGVIDLLFKQVSMLKAFSEVLFFVFVIAGGLLFALFTLRGVRWDLNSALVGLLLGLLNFGNILFYIQAHQQLKNPSLVFTCMNLGVIIFGTLIGKFGFKESVSRLNYAGIGLGILAVPLLFYWQ